MMLRYLLTDVLAGVAYQKGGETKPEHRVTDAEVKGCGRSP